MASYILKDGDEVKFFTEFTTATVTVQSGFIKASGKATINQTPICVEGDEKSVMVKGCSYINKAEQFSGGTGTLKISLLKEAHISSKTKIGEKAVLLNANRIPFDAEFVVDTPGKQPSPSEVFDVPGRVYSKGQGYFEAKNTKTKSS